MGTSCDWSKEKFTLDDSMNDRVNKAFVDLYNKGLIYRGEYMVNYDPVMDTVVSDQEVIYKEEPGKLYDITYFVSGSDNEVATFTDSDGKGKPIVMGSYGIGVGRLLACLCEEHNDEKGLKLPYSVVPYHVIITAILDNDEVKAVADQLYADLRSQGVEVIYDDRGKKVATPGVKFRDSELIGIPLRLTVSKKSILKGGVEFKIRGEKDFEILPVDEAISKVKETIATELGAIKKSLDGIEKWPTA